MKELNSALEQGIKDFFLKAGFQKAVIGSSGGIDSALVQTLASNALGAENVTAFIMPSEFSSQGSVDDAVALCNNLGNPFHIIKIAPLYELYLHTLKEVYGNTNFDLTEENLQARIRATLLMAYSNKKHALLLNTSNKSELAVGYGTLYGDLCGAISVIGNLYKTQVYQLARHLNKDQEIIPNHIIQKAPSAELHPGQKDSDSLPEYAELDKVLVELIDNQKSVEQVVAQGFSEELVSRIVKLVQRSEFKKAQVPPILYV
ncbi:MAG: NAD(+) synthase [Bacteroidia bacterium]|nr:NAD(+) synthase [Bacteroidia bacterium]